MGSDRAGTETRLRERNSCARSAVPQGLAAAEAQTRKGDARAEEARSLARPSRSLCLRGFHLIPSALFPRCHKWGAGSGMEFRGQTIKGWTAAGGERPET